MRRSRRSSPISAISRGPTWASSPDNLQSPALRRGKRKFFPLEFRQMASKIHTTDLKVGMFVADLDRPWVDTPFLLQGFLVENQEQILALKTHCEYVIVDRARSTGDQFEAPAAAAIAVARQPPGSLARNAAASTSPENAHDATHLPPPPSVETKPPAKARNQEPTR